MATCPRCSRPLYPELDHDYGCCLIHGSQYIGLPLEAPPGPYSHKARRVPQVLNMGKAKSGEE